MNFLRAPNKSPLEQNVPVEASGKGVCKADGGVLLKSVRPQSKQAKNCPKIAENVVQNSHKATLS